MDVQTGILMLVGGGTDTGNFNTATGAVMQFGNGTHDLNAGTTFTGTGVIELSTGTLNANTAASIPNFTQTSGVLSGPAVVTVTGNASFTGAASRSMVGAGTLRLQGTTTIDMVSGSNTGGIYVDSGYTLRNEGTATWTAGYIELDSSSLAGSGTLNNAGTFLVDGNVSGTVVSNFRSGWRRQQQRHLPQAEQHGRQPFANRGRLQQQRHGGRADGDFVVFERRAGAYRHGTGSRRGHLLA